MCTGRGSALLLALVVAGCTSPPPSPTPPAPTSRPTPTAASLVPSPAAATVTPTPASASTTPLPSPLTAIVPGEVGRSSLAVSATYDVDLGVTVATGDLVVRTTIAARNDAGVGIDRLELNTIAARLGHMGLAEVSVDGQPRPATIDDQTIGVPLGGILPAGASATIVIGYTARLTGDLAGSDWLFSRAGGTLALYRWIPWVSTPLPFDRPNHGDPFETPTSPAVHVRVTTDRPVVLASPGAAPVLDGRTWTFDVADVRDVALVMAPDFHVTEGSAGGVPIRIYTRPGGLDGAQVLAQAMQALERIGDRVGVPYPWPAYGVVETAGGYGMESPELTWVPRQTTAANLAYLVHHETAHQWFYSLVGNDQQGQPFADEAAADMTARSILGLLRASGCPATSLDRAITAYSRACYYEDVYIQGALVLDQIRRAMGTDRFWTAVRDYLQANRYSLAGTRQLLETLRLASPADLGPILRSRFPTLYP